VSKLFKLREWLTIPDTAKHLSNIFEEEITEADVLRLALEGKLRLSVYFVNHTKARPGKTVRYTRADLETDVAAGKFSEDLKWSTFPPEIVATLPGIPEEMKGKPMTYLRSLPIGDDRFLTLSDEVTTIEGVWDLPMIGAEQLDVEHHYQNLTGGPAVTLSNIEGAFVEDSDGRIWQLQEDYDNNEYQSGSRAQLDDIKRYIAEKNISDEEAEKLLSQHKENRKQFLERRKVRPVLEHYYPAGGLPMDDSVLVIRTSALREFEELVSDSTKDRTAEANGRRKQQHEIILAVIAALQYDAHQIPDGGKAKIRKACLTRLHWFTTDSFEHAWKAGLSSGLFRLANSEKYSSKHHN
jgi:hypothetical protein